jgi:hypothetical protein
MPPTPNSQTPLPTPLPDRVAATPSAIIKFLRIFLGVLIGIGLVLIATQHLWVPTIVNTLVPPLEGTMPTEGPILVPTHRSENF